MNNPASDITHLVGTEVLIGETELIDRAVTIVADVLKVAPFLKGNVSAEVRTMVLDKLRNSGEIDILDYPHPEEPIHQTRELPRLLAHASNQLYPQLALGDHSERVSDLASHMAAAMGLPRSSINNIRVGGLIHDLGKLDSEMADIASTPNDVEIPPERKARIVLHPVLGDRVAKYFGFPQEVADFALKHHFRFGEKDGYPSQNGADMSPEVGTISAADSFDAMVVRRDKSISDAICELQEGSGGHFHPDAIRSLSRVSIGRVYGV